MTDNEFDDKVSLWLSPSHLEAAHAMAEDQGIPYKVMMSSVVHRYLSGLLVDKEYPNSPTGGAGQYKLDEEEREILEYFEHNEARSVPDVERRLEEARQIARNTLRSTKKVELSLSEDNLRIAREMAEEVKMPYQAMVARAVYRYLAGLLVERETSSAVGATRQPQKMLE